MNAIYLDTNIIPQGANLDTLEFSSLIALARDGGHELLVPDLVVDEAASQRLRSIEAAFDLLRKAHRDAGAFANIPLLGDLPNPGELVREYRSRLTSLCRTISTPEWAGQEALYREAFRLPPAREGKGARDCAIWLTVKSAHEASGEDGYFLSNNSKDFADPMDKARLHPTLQDEINGSPLQLISSVSDLVQTLASPEPRFIDEPFIQTNKEECSRAIIKSIEETDLRNLIQETEWSSFKKESAKLYIAGRVQSRALAVHESRAFFLENHKIGIAWSQWDLTIPVGVLEKTGAGMSQVAFNIFCRGTFQLWVRLQEESVSVEAPHVRSLKIIPDT